MKRKMFPAFILMLAFIVSGQIGVLAADNSALVFVTVANGELMTARLPVTVTDADGDGVLTINDALIAVHKQAYEGGAAGYITEEGEFGAFIVRLWGVENGGSYGYYQNNAMAMGLTSPVKSGDSVAAYVFTDYENFTDTYTYFDTAEFQAAPGESKTLTLYSVGFDADFNPVSNPVAGAVITIDGKSSEFVTDSNGKADIIIADAGSYIISAESDTAVIVPPAAVAAVSAGAPATGDCHILLAAAAASIAAAVITVRRKKNET